MRLAQSIVLVVLFLAAGAAAYWLVKRGPPAPTDQPGVTASAPARLNVSGEWPCFRGGPSLPGVAQGRLGDSLKLYWRFKAPDAIRSSPVVAGGLVYVGCDDGHLFALDLGTGTEAWRFKAGDAVAAPPMVHNGVVYVGSLDGSLQALDAASGQRKWTYKTDGAIHGSANWAESGGQLRILVGSYDFCLHCVDAAGGERIWSYKTENYINGTVSVNGDTIVFGGCDQKIHVVSLADGNEVKAIDIGQDNYVAASAALADNSAYVGTYNNKFLCVDVERGRIVWTYDGQGSFFSCPALGKDRVVVGAQDSRTHCIRRDDGRAIWTFPARGNVDSSPVICGDKVVFGSDDGRLYMVRLADGGEVWSFETGGAISAGPAVVGGAVIVGCQDGWVYAFGPK